ncbi:hypothetical protein JTB14_015908 [Gonioctena quinquepunctata]|nr:hypothetical protein JTB14_015908 [Gonioctena quinquepunctata]
MLAKDPSETIYKLASSKIKLSYMDASVQLSDGFCPRLHQKSLEALANKLAPDDSLTDDQPVHTDFCLAFTHLGDYFYRLYRICFPLSYFPDA